MPKHPQRTRPTPHNVEAEVAHGLESVARQELTRQLGPYVRWAAAVGQPGALRFEYVGDLRALTKLRTVQAVYLLHHFELPRPKALLGDQHFRTLVALLETVRALDPAAFQTLHIGAAGADSSVMLRLKAELAQATRLRTGADEGDLLLRLRRGPDGEGWEALVRIGPRPLATRAWRVQNYGGALNATVAHAMALLTQPRPDDVVLNLACGSGTLLIERLAAAPAARVLGCDTHPDALAAAQANIAAAKQSQRIELHPWDARDLPLPDANINVLLADLPFGNLQGSHSTNTTLYPAILQEAARVATSDARFALITHEARLMQNLLAQHATWIHEQTIMVTLGGLHPRIYLLRRAPAAA